MSTMKLFSNSSIDLQTPWACRRAMGQVRFQLEAIQSPCPQSSQCTVLRWKFQVHDRTADSFGSLWKTRNLASFRSSIHVQLLFMSNCNRRCRELGFPTKCNRYAMFINRYILVLYFILIIVFVESSFPWVMQSCRHAVMQRLHAVGPFIFHVLSDGEDKCRIPCPRHGPGSWNSRLAVRDDVLTSLNPDPQHLAQQRPTEALPPVGAQSSTAHCHGFEQTEEIRRDF